MTVAKKEEEQKAGLVLVKDAAVGQYLDTLNLKTGRGLAGAKHDPDAFARGKEEGAKLKLRRSLGEQTTNQNGTLQIGPKK